MKENIVIRREEEKDYRETENLVREAFWNVYRPGCTEHFVLHCMRNNSAFVPELDFIMLLDGKEIGQVAYAWAEVKLSDGGILPVMTFGPIGILPEFKRGGRGSGRAVHHRQYRFLRQERLRSGKNQRHSLLGRPRRRLLSRKRTQKRLFKRKIRRLRRSRLIFCCG